ncbi:predicted protein [Nematostella vectensis]|uniref:Uncharacterized protein n=1 Tax=Nematostella vectensis TaxID=45351 RepID=A7RFH9_NEMVE|nr:predicted protein [Nematostella vectensis]|eukprot:XP_001641787.1 predicted protein [Nematostella vectensis]
MDISPSPNVPDIPPPTTPSPPRMTPTKIRAFFQGIHRGSRNRLGNSKSRVQNLFSSGRKDRKKSLTDLEERLPFVEMAEKEGYGSTAKVHDEHCELLGRAAESATKALKREKAQSVDHAMSMENETLL